MLLEIKDIVAVKFDYESKAETLTLLFFFWLIHGARGFIVNFDRC